MSLSNRLDRLEKSPGLSPRPLTLFYSYGEAAPVVPDGYDPVTLVLEYVVDKVEADGTAHVVDPWNPDGPRIVRRPGEALPDRTPRGETR